LETVYGQSPGGTSVSLVVRHISKVQRMSKIMTPLINAVENERSIWNSKLDSSEEEKELA